MPSQLEAKDKPRRQTDSRDSYFSDTSRRRQDHDFCRIGRCFVLSVKAVIALRGAARLSLLSKGRSWRWARSVAHGGHQPPTSLVTFMHRCCQLIGGLIDNHIPPWQCARRRLSSHASERAVDMGGGTLSWTACKGKGQWRST